MGTSVAGLLLGAAGAAVAARFADRVPLGAGLLLVLLWLAALLLLGTGILRLRHGSDGSGDRAPTATSWACLVVDHRFGRVPAGPDAPEHWRCRRCGKRRCTRPASAGETLNATRVHLGWIDRGDALGGRR